MLAARSVTWAAKGSEHRLQRTLDAVTKEGIRKSEQVLSVSGPRAVYVSVLGWVLKQTNPV